MPRTVCCVDFGSTYTKAALVDVCGGGLLATASAPTAVHTDVLDGWDVVRDELAAIHPQVREAEVIACSSAGGGLRIAVVGNEELVTAEAGRRVALSSGGRVVTVISGGLTASSHVELHAAAPDVVLLVGGTDGGNPQTLVDSARTLAEGAERRPVVVAGNAEAQVQVGALLDAADVPYRCCDNVVPRIGVLQPEPARAAIRAMFLEHVIGGKGLSRRAEFTAMVRGATPDVVLRAVELLATIAGDVAVVDIGGATTDVHSVAEVDPEDAGLAREVVAPTAVSRTVEGDLGMRWSALATIAAGREAGLLDEHQYDDLEPAARRRQDDPSYLASGAQETEADQRLATLACGVALRRHAGRQQIRFGPDGRIVERAGKDLREIDLLVGSGGILRHRPTPAAIRVLQASCGRDVAGGWLLPRLPRAVVDHDCVLAAAGLLAPDHPATAAALLRRLVDQTQDLTEGEPG
ncbi:MAG: glutamate mutase L [Actinomycetota bacterium]|nr:glutamate mutase L [Actinomycetota bacterium]